jgi:hypothetical protein
MSVSSARRCSAFLSAIAFLVAPLAFGQSSEPGKPCQADVQKLCPGIKPGHGAILGCLEGKQDQVSAACKDEVKAKLEAFYEACKPDVEKFCATVPKGQGAILKCLKKNEAGLSDSCKAVWAKAKAAKAKAMAPSN